MQRREIVDPPADLVRTARESDDIVRTALEGARPDLVKPIAPAPISGVAACLTTVAGDPYRPSHRTMHQLPRARRLHAPLPGLHPRDAVAHIDAELGAAALKMMERNVSAGLTTAADCLG
jgi:hypothetical protein